MWYLRKEASSCKEICLVSTCLRPKNINICFQNLGNDREDQNGVRQTSFGFDNEKKFSDKFCWNRTFSIF